MMRRVFLTLLALALAAPAAAGTVPARAAADTPRCEPRSANLGGVGSASVVSFTAPISGGTVCAVVANLSIDAFTARVGPDPAPDALVNAALGSGGAVTLPLEGATITGVGPYAVEPGGVFPSFGADAGDAPRVVLAYAGQRVLIMSTTTIPLVDLARVLRSQSSLFGTDAVERAVVLSSGPAATIEVRSAAGAMGAAPATQRILQVMKR